jgi:predicted DCC family thiol-disulfide oxidoreductase YuxK
MAYVQACENTPDRDWVLVVTANVSKFSSDGVPARYASIEILYDGECPFCSRYAWYQSIAQAADKVSLQSLRDVPAPSQALIERFSLDPNKGIIVLATDHQGIVTGLGGRESMMFLSTLDEQPGWRGTLHRTMRNSSLARFAYPLLTTGRHILLFLMGRNPTITSGKAST